MQYSIEAVTKIPIELTRFTTN